MTSKQTTPRDGLGPIAVVAADTCPVAIPGGGRSDFDLDFADNGNSQQGWSSIAITKWDRSAASDRRSDKIRIWRRRALLKRGARLHMSMVSSAQASSLAMLDETGIVVCWYGSSEGRDYASEEVVDRHVSLFYVSEDVVRRQPHRDLRAAVTEGRVTRQTWRRGHDGSAFWGTIDIQPLVLRDGRVQGFSYVATAPDQVRHSAR